MAASAMAASAAASQSLRNRKILDAVGTIAAALSLTGSSFIALWYLLFRELRKFSFKPVYFLVVAKLKVKKAIEKGIADGVRIYAENAIRKRTKHMNYLPPCPIYP